MEIGVDRMAAMPRMLQGSGGDRAITAAGLRRLLERLHPDPEEASREYEHVRRALGRFFEGRGIWPPDECADVVIDRLARRLEENTPIENVRQYAYGVARLVLLEQRRRQPAISIEHIDRLAAVPARAHDEDPLQDSLERCLAAIPPEGRALLLAYYQGERAAKIASRRKLAAALGLSDNALRSRVQRLRERLEHCIRASTPGVV